MLSQAARNRVHRPPNSHRRDQRHKGWPLHRAFHLTSHHLLGFIRLHVPIVLRHLLQSCLATSHLCRIKGICIVLQDSQLEEGKGRRRVRVLPAFWRGGVRDQLKPLETSPQALLAAARAAARTPSLHHGSPAEQVLAAGSFPGTGAWPWKCSSWDRAKQSRRWPGLLPYHWLSTASARTGALAKPLLWCRAASSAASPPWHADALPGMQPHFLPQGREGVQILLTGVSAGTGTIGNSQIIFQGSCGLVQRHFLTEGLQTAHSFPSLPSLDPAASPHVSQVTQDRAPPYDQESPGSRTRSLSSATSRGWHKKLKVYPYYQKGNDPAGGYGACPRA